MSWFWVFFTRFLKNNVLQFIYVQDFKVCVYAIYTVIVFYLLNAYFLINFHSITHCLVCLLACLDWFIDLFVY